MNDLTITHTSTVTDDQIDHLGHMNVRFYGVNARAAGARLVRDLGLPVGVDLHLVDAYTRHHREQLLGAALEVRSGLVGADPRGLSLYHELAAVDGPLAACFVHRLEPVPRGDRPERLPDHVVESAAARILEIPEHGRGRSISLDAPLPTPALDELLRRGLEMRKERSIGIEECDDDGRLLVDALPGLTWGGEPPDHRRDGYVDMDPQESGMGWATMETRMRTARLPRVGDRIQAFGAAIEIRDKTSHRVQWVYDVGRGEPLTTFEVVNLAFHIGDRRAMSIPDRLRTIEESTLAPDLVGPVTGA